MSIYKYTKKIINKDSAINERGKHGYELHYSDGGVRAVLTGNAPNELIGKARDKDLQSWDLFKNAPGFHGTNQDEYLMYWYDKTGHGYWSNVAKRDPELLNKRYNTTTESTQSDQQFDYMMLGRLASDCEYFLGNGSGSENSLWAHSVDKQIEEMKRIWNVLVVKPEWLSMEDILSYEKRMKEYGTATTTESAQEGAEKYVVCSKDRTEFLYRRLPTSGYSVTDDGKLASTFPSKKDAEDVMNLLRRMGAVAQKFANLTEVVPQDPTDSIAESKKKSQPEDDGYNGIPSVASVMGLKDKFLEQTTVSVRGNKVTIRVVNRTFHRDINDTISFKITDRIEALKKDIQAKYPGKTIDWGYSRRMSESLGKSFTAASSALINEPAIKQFMTGSVEGKDYISYPEDSSFTFAFAVSKENAEKINSDQSIKDSIKAAFTKHNLGLISIDCIDNGEDEYFCYTDFKNLAFEGLDKYDDMDRQIPGSITTLKRVAEYLGKNGFTVTKTSEPNYDEDGLIELGDRLHVAVGLDNTFYASYETKTGGFMMGNSTRSLPKLLADLKAYKAKLDANESAILPVTNEGLVIMGEYEGQPQESELDDDYLHDIANIAISSGDFVKKVTDAVTDETSTISDEDKTKLRDWYLNIIVELLNGKSIDDAIAMGYSKSDVIAANGRLMKTVGGNAVDGDRTGDDPSSKQYFDRTIRNESKTRRKKISAFEK